MNYRTMVKGALALSLSLIVGTSWAGISTTNDVPQYGVTFETTVSTTAPLNDRPYVAETLIGTNNTTVSGDSFGWFSGSEEDESKIIAANGGQALQLNTDSATLTNKLAAADKTAFNNAIAAKGAYIETDVKFVASDTPDAGVTGGADATKFAIYAYNNEDAPRPEGVPATTNLVVYHAYYDENDEIAYTNEVFDTLIDAEVYTKLRIEMKKMTNPANGAQLNVFSVKVGNSEPLVSKVAFDAYVDDDLTTGSWFLTVEDQDDAPSRQVSSFNFKGTGEIDNISVGVIDITTKVATVDGTDYDNWTDALAAIQNGSVVTAYEDGTIDLASGTITLNKNGFNVTVTTSTSGKKIQDNGDGTYTVVDDYTAATVFTVAGNVTNTIGNYATLAEALAAATDGATVLVLDDLTLDARVEPNVGANTAITIDLGGKTITRTGTTGNGSVFDVKSGDVVITNGVIVCTQDDTAIVADGVYAITSRNGSNVTLADLVVLVNSECGACAYPFAGSTMTIESGAYSNLTQTTYRYNTAITGMAVNQPNITDQLLIIKGGTFSQYDPQLGDDSGAMADFTDDGFVAIDDGNGNWVVQPGFNVTFNADGGLPAPEAQRVAAGGTATAPTAPEKEGFTFGGWTLNGAAFDFDTVLDADIALVASWTEVVNATIISVAKLSATGAMVGDAAPTLTATVTDENGDAVAAADYTIDASAIDMTTAGLYPVIITATGAGYAGTLTNYYAVMNLTWFNGTPTQKAMLTNASVGLGGSLNEASHWMSKSEHGRFLAINHHGGNASTGRGVLSLYEIATLTNLYGACYSHWEFAQGSASEASKGVAVSEAAGLVIRGNVDYSPTAELTYAIDDVSNKEFGTELSYAFIKDGAPETRKHDGLAFSTDGNYFYVNTYDPSASQHIIGKYSVDKANNQFVWMQDYVGSVTRIRSVVLYQINGKDYVFYGEGGGSKTGNIYAMDTVTGESTLVCSALESSVFANDGSKEIMLVRISGIASGEMYLYAHSNKGTIVVWALRHDATSGAWKTALVREFTKAEYLALCDRESLSNSRNFEVSDDNQYGFILPHQTQDARLIIVSDISLAQRKALASATLMPAGSYQDVELGEITATVLDANGDTVAASEYTITTNAIDIATLGEYTVTITPVEGSVYSNAVTAVYTISEEPAAPTVITVACVGGVTYTEADGVYTFTADTGYAISSIYTNGADTATASTGILDLSAAEGTINVVAAAKKIRTAAAHKWFENPTIVGTTTHGLKTGGSYGIWHLNGDGDYIAGTSWATQDNMVKAYDVDALVAGAASPVISNRYDATSQKYVWGAAVSTALNTVFVGSYTEDPIVAPALAYPLNVAEGTMGVDSFVISNDQGIAINDAEFTADGQYLYAAAYYPTASRQYVYKFRVLNGLKSSGMNLEYVEKYDFGQRIRSIGLGQFSGKDVVYALLNDKTVKYVDTSAAEPVATALISGYTVLGGNYGDVVVSGADTETPHITIFGSNSGTSAYSIDVYTLTTTGTLASSDPVLALDTAAVAALGLPNVQFGFSGFVTENEETLILSWGTSNLYAIQYVEPQYTATYTGSENVIVTNTYDGSSYEWGEGEAVVPTQVACLSGTVLSFYPTEGNVITNVTIGGVAQTGFDPACYSITVISDTNLVVLAGASAAKFKAGDTYGTVKLSAAQAEWLNGFNNYDAIDAALKTDSSNLEKRYLLNVDPLTGSGDLTITAITVGTDVKVTVALTRAEGATAVTGKAIKGTLKLYGTADLATDFAALGSVTFDDATFAESDTATATFTGSGAKFFKAVIE